MTFIHIVTTVIWLSSFILIMYLLYNAVVSAFSLRRTFQLPSHTPEKRFAVLIPARNEAKVIGNLINSLKRQNYPKHLYKIIVIPNNCTDETKKVALENGANVMDCTERVATKGEVLSFAFKTIAKEAEPFDACCIFDADNLVGSNFLEEMNNALCSGAKVAQGYRDSKNPGDSWIASCHSIYYYSVNRLYNHARSVLGLSAVINGTGFMVHMDVINGLGGWNTVTMTEDLEFSTICTLNDIRVHWIPKARFYDEQPITFQQSWMQRLRWSKGAMQCSSNYAGKLLTKAIKGGTIQPVDILSLLIAPWIQIISFISLSATVILTCLQIKYELFPQTDLFYRLFISLEGSYLIPTLITLMVVIIEKKNIRTMAKGILMMWVFVMSWIPINLLCIFNKTVVWHPIHHTRAITLGELEIQ